MFYGWWDWRFLSLIFISTGVDFVLAQLISNAKKYQKRKFLLLLSIFINIGLLVFFKYFNFFIDSFIKVLNFFNLGVNSYALRIILPVGISFYTFQTLSYTIDVYKKRISATNNFFAFSAYVSFFPQLVAGPIERATNFLPQFYKKHVFSIKLALEGCSQILYGFFLKIVVADKCALIVNPIFNNYAEQSSLELLFGAFFFSFQIYGDFAGYSSIAIGLGKLFGFKLDNNFLYPYFSRDIAEFWRRWHISLSSWFKDYVYIPLGGSKAGNLISLRNVFAIFLLSGLWHGANWTFVFWGGLNAILFIPLFVFKLHRKNNKIIDFKKSRHFLKEISGVILTFIFVSVAWVFFRSPNITDAFNYLMKIFTNSFFTQVSSNLFITALFVILLIMIDWYGREYDYPLKKFFEKHNSINFIAHFIILLIVLFFAEYHSTEEFIYFQF